MKDKIEPTFVGKFNYNVNPPEPYLEVYLGDKFVGTLEGSQWNTENFDSEVDKLRNN